MKKIEKENICLPRIQIRKIVYIQKALFKIHTLDNLEMATRKFNIDEVRPYAKSNLSQAKNIDQYFIQPPGLSEAESVSSHSLSCSRRSNRVSNTADRKLDKISFADTCIQVLDRLSSNHCLTTNGVIPICQGINGDSCPRNSKCFPSEFYFDLHGYVRIFNKQCYDCCQKSSCSSSLDKDIKSREVYFRSCDEHPRSTSTCINGDVPKCIGKRTYDRTTQCCPHGNNADFANVYEHNPQLMCFKPVYFLVCGLCYKETQKSDAAHPRCMYNIYEQGKVRVCGNPTQVASSVGPYQHLICCIYCLQNLQKELANFQNNPVVLRSILHKYSPACARCFDRAYPNGPISYPTDVFEKEQEKLSILRARPYRSKNMDTGKVETTFHPFDESCYEKVKAEKISYSK